jgi:hypothetical protein
MFAKEFAGTRTMTGLAAGMRKDPLAFFIDVMFGD